MSGFAIRAARREDAETWRSLRNAHWPSGAEDHEREIAAFFAGTAAEPQAVFLAERKGEVVAVMELSIRIDLASLVGVKVGYVEGFYIVPRCRGKGLARLLLRAAQEWSRKQGCTAFASDRAGRVIVDPNFGID